MNSIHRYILSAYRFTVQGFNGGDHICTLLNNHKTAHKKIHLKRNYVLKNGWKGYDNLYRLKKKHRIKTNKGYRMINYMHRIAETWRVLGINHQGKLTDFEFRLKPFVYGAWSDDPIFFDDTGGYQDQLDVTDPMFFDNTGYHLKRVDVTDHLLSLVHACNLVEVSGFNEIEKFM